MLYVDYRDMPLGENIPRNSVAFRVRFMSSIEIGGRRQVGAIIHLEMADSDIYAPGNYSGNRWFHNKRANEDFYPGQLEIQFIRSVPESNSALHTSAFPITTTMTLGALISAAMANQMHKFVFLPRHRVNQLVDWEGTTDFFLQFWALLVRRGEVSLQDTEGHPLANTIGWFYRPNAPPMYIGVPRGIFIEFERIDDVLTQVPVPVMNGR
ncbi:hypothetical protein NEOLEDRAFT_1143077 [Neolentinus lepideus HHB14362 ss-1]|uniref:Uncharacterized protein n=1 Tax=Neolentinus lepideus HHB14362 ss-1 TaxID=1314782 RepID=A0A165MSA1_9AGAM|nr:hypothetical protein NEOLEDRAFT_1143077 [Neolentinus lepideus HHB14362 ss-1]